MSLARHPPTRKTKDARKGNRFDSKRPDRCPTPVATTQNTRFVCAGAVNPVHASYSWGKRLLHERHLFLECDACLVPLGSAMHAEFSSGDTSPIIGYTCWNDNSRYGSSLYCSKRRSSNPLATLTAETTTIGSSLCFSRSDDVVISGNTCF